VRQVCLLCERSAPDRNLYCNAPACTAEQSPLTLDYGERLSDIEIVRLVVVTRTSALYDARQHGRRVLLKVAHPGNENTDRLKREAELLASLQAQRKLPPYLPTLLPPFVGVSIDKQPYGRTMLGEHLLYFCLFAHTPGEPLRAVLTQTPQLWIYHVGWIVQRVGAALAYLQSADVLHLALSPEVVLVQFSERSADPQVLLCDLGVVARPEEVAQIWQKFALPPTAPAYTPAELLDSLPRADYRSDVYGLGLLLYELLLGGPAYPYRLRDEDAVRADVRAGRIAPMRRRDDVAPIATLAEQATARDPATRPADVRSFVQQLDQYVVPPARPRSDWWKNPRFILTVVIVLLGAAFLVLFLLSLVELLGLRPA
jgi:serine/threonine protein kinase